MGIELPADSPETPEGSGQGGAEPGAPDASPRPIGPGLASLIGAWPILPEPVKAAVRALVGSVPAPSCELSTKPPPGTGRNDVIISYATGTTE